MSRFRPSRFYSAPVIIAVRRGDLLKSLIHPGYELYDAMLQKEPLNALAQRLARPDMRFGIAISPVVWSCVGKAAPYQTHQIVLLRQLNTVDGPQNFVKIKPGGHGIGQRQFGLFIRPYHKNRTQGRIVRRGAPLSLSPSLAGSIS